MAESKINGEYSDQFARQALEKHKSQKHFTGQNLLSVTESKQVNLLILWMLKDAWEVEKANLTSPFFDYESEQVNTALKNLVNALSQNIKLSRDTAKGQVEAAVLSALQLVENPSAWISGQLEKFAKPAIPLPKLKELGKYITHHRAVLDAVVKEADVAATKQVLKGDLTRMLYQNAPQLKTASDHLRAELNAILEMPKPGAKTKEEQQEEAARPQNLFEQIEAAEEEEVQAEETFPAPEPEPAAYELSEQEAVPVNDAEKESMPEPEPIYPEAMPEPIVPVEPEFTPELEPEPEPAPAPPPAPKKPELKPAPKPAPQAEPQIEPVSAEKEGAMAAESPEPTQFYQKLQGHDSFYNSIKEKNIKKLSESISMALKFRFISSLFENNAGEYQAAIDRLDHAASGEDALKILHTDLGKPRGWNLESEVYQELEKVVKRRFQQSV